MNKKNLLLIILTLGSFTAFSQTLFTYGNNSVSVTEFMRAYHKNNTQPVTNKAKSIQDYLELYINSRLKIREAYERGYDTLPQIKTEVDNLRNQILESYISDPEIMNFLAKQAFTRSQKDIHAAHIFIGIGGDDTTTAFATANRIHQQLKQGGDFLALAQQYSEDPSAKTNRGDIGWITVFTLPYTFENEMYNLTPGTYSRVIRTRAGYHIFKNIGERKAVGKMKAKHILIAFPPGADETIKNKAAAKIDSIYKRLLAGDDFDKLAQAFSNDYLTAVSGGSMPDFGVGQFEPAFESAVWALAKNGAFTKPFKTSHGYHIVKRVSVVAVPTDPTDKLYDQEIRQKITTDQRLKLASDAVYDRVVQQAKLDKGEVNSNALWALTDSLLDTRPTGNINGLTRETKLFTLGDTTLRINDWINYAQTFRYKRDGSGRKAYPDLMNEFQHAVASQYYRDHLETFNDEFRYQMNEFKDGNLFFEIMQQDIWNRAHSDSTELLALYETNKTKYTWSKSADAVIFFCSDQVVAKTLYDQLKKNPANWRTLTDALTEKVVADSARYEWAQIPSKTKIIPVAGMVTAPLVNATDNTASFAYVLKTYPQTMQRNFQEAKGLVINDYQTILEEQWIKQLKQKYPVVINQAVLAGLK